MPDNLPTDSATPQQTLPTAEEPREERALLDIVPLAMVAYIQAIPQDLLDLPENELRDVCYPRGKKRQEKVGNRSMLKETVFETDSQLRLAFWNEYERAITVGRRMQAQFIFGQTIHGQNFYKRVCANPHRLAWIICPPGDYQAKLTHALNSGIERLNEIFAMPITSQPCRCHYGCICKHPDGYTRKQQQEMNCTVTCACKDECICPKKVDAKVADVILRALERVEMRVKGAVVQKIDERRLQVNLFGKAPGSPPDELPTDMEAVERRIKELEELTATPPKQLSPAPDTANILTADFREADPLPAPSSLDNPQTPGDN